MATIRTLSLSLTSSAKFAGLFFGFLVLAGCQTGKPPEEITASFWQALAQGQLDQARTQVTQKTQHLVGLNDIDKLSTVTTGKATEDDDSARVPTTIMKNRQIVAFDTVLHLENDVWKVDYLQTQLNITLSPLGDVAKSLVELGGSFAKQLQEQLPLIQKSMESQLPLIQKNMESLGIELKKQIEQFNRSLKIPPKPSNPGYNGRQI